MTNAPCIDNADGAQLSLAGEQLRLRGDCSLFWPGRRTLFVADTHFGKSSVFRRQGMGLPQGTTSADLARLSAALEATGAQRLVVLGDFMHAPPRPEDQWPARVAAWRDRHPTVEMVVLRGNHDRVASLRGLDDVSWRGGSVFEPPFVWRHEPDDDPRGPVLSGHIHPVVRIGDASETLRVPVFWLTGGRLVLPAFCSFAGGGRITPYRGDRLFAVGEGEVIELASA